MKQYILIAFLIFAGTSITAQMAHKIEFTEFDLDNGLHVILHEDHSTPIVAVSVMYHVGSKNEDPNRRGFAHFFEHLLFEGSEYIERGMYSKYVENAGGTLNANTSFDRTYYYEILPSNQLELGLWLESERMLHAKVDKKGVETQRDVVKEERRQRVENQPYGDLLEQTLSRAYHDHPYRWPIIGYMEDLNAATEADYKEFYETFYVPNNATLVIAGDIDKEQASAWVEKYFSGIPKGDQSIPRPDVEEPPLAGEVRDTVFDEIQLPAVIQAYRTPEMTHEDSYALQMLSRLLSKGESSRMYKSIVDEQQKALFVANFPLPMEDPGLSLMYGIAAAGVDVGVLEEAMNEEIEKVREELISQREYEKLRNQIDSEFVSKNARISGIAENLATYHTFYGNTNLVNTEIKRYMDVTREDIREAARKYFVKDNRVVLYYLPKPNMQ